MTETPPERKSGPVTQFGKASLNTEAQIGTDGRVEHALNGVRLAVLGILVTIGLTVGFGMPGPWWERLAWGLGSFVVACFLVRWRRSRKLLMEFMHRLTER